MLGSFFKCHNYPYWLYGDVIFVSYNASLIATLQIWLTILSAEIFFGVKACIEARKNKFSCIVYFLEIINLKSLNQHTTGFNQNSFYYLLALVSGR